LDGLTSTFLIDTAIVPVKDGTAGPQNFDSGTLFLDYGQNRVGIGTVSPTEELDVSGDAQVLGEYKYSGAKFYDYFVHAGAFVQPHGIDDEEWRSTGGGFRHLSGGTPTFVSDAEAGVNLPQGAVVIQLSCYFFDNDATANVSFIIQLVRMNISAGVSTMTSMVQPQTPLQSSLIQTISNTSISIPTIDNAHAYYLYLDNFSTLNIAPTTNIRWYGCRITYVLSQVSH
jgi:hypothetical protein